MGMPRAACIVGVLFIAASFPSPAATPTAYKVAVADRVHEDDNVGAMLVFALKEEVRKSSGFSLERVDAKGHHLIIYITTMDPDSGTPSAGRRTCYSLAIAGRTDDGTDLLLRTSVGLAGVQRTSESAREILAGIDQMMGH
jgi:hypothetical protein